MRINASDIAGLLAAALLAAAGAEGCVKFSPATDSPADSTPRRIEFPTPIVSPVTKADAAKRSDYPEDSSFGVYGLWYPDSSTFTGWESTTGAATHIDGDRFFYDSRTGSADKNGAWISSPVHYWLPSGKMAFAAWSPYSLKESTGETLSYGAGGLSVKDFSTGSGGRDLMYSERVYDKTSSRGSNTTYDGIDLVFHHALASLCFKTTAADGGDESSIVKLTGIELWGFDGKGTFTENVDETDPTHYASAPAWTGLDDLYTEDSPCLLSAPQLQAYIIPQTISDDAKIRIHYSVKIGDSPAIPSVSEPLSLSGHKVAGTEDVLSEWKMGTRYVYNIIITSVVKIKFSIDINPWTSANEEDGVQTIGEPEL